MTALSGCHVNIASRKSLEIQAYSTTKPRNLLERKFVWKLVFSCSNTPWKWNLGRIDSFVVWILVTSSENQQLLKLTTSFIRALNNLKQEKTLYLQLFQICKKGVPLNTLHLVFVSSCLYFPACPVIRISGSQPLSGIASRSSPNCWMCFFGWSRCTMLVVRQIVVKEKRNFCWCWFSLVVDSRHTFECWLLY